MIDEIDDPALRRKVIRLCIAVAIADDYLADGEIALLAAVFNAWGTQPDAGRQPHGAAVARTCARTHARAAATT